MSRNSKKVNVLLWIAQALLALLFVFAGTMKFFEPIETMQQSPIRFSATFFHFIGICEIMGGLGLVLPGLFRTRQYLTPLAAAGLVVIMAGGTVVTVPVSAVGALVPFAVGMLAFTIFRARGGVSLIRSRAASPSPVAATR